METIVIVAADLVAISLLTFGIYFHGTTAAIW
jgi:hypothetical protein